ncbi:MULTISPECIES: plastocyanin/azurin family copper-binding protein [Natrialbaceae]|uniref:plastocyanin/azurin family copper-binding protein n=1 Tax=Natrialbaceae TaxID=1644061 RepID=UPI00207C3811|nr:plastocyanin/azurin family copper-binding protein [Natronococcus sp. CG52]
MTRDNGISRRTAMKVTGAAAATALVAGCSDDNGGDENGENGGDENGENGENGGDGHQIEAGETIELEADSGGWIGVAPDDIADEDNPTLILEEGEDYEIGWEEGDGSTHNLELVDENDEVVEDYETDEASEGGEDQFIEFEATSDIAEYLCRPHDNAMVGTIEVEEGEGGNGADEEENGEDENGEDGNETDENGEDEVGEDENGDNESDE